MVAGCSVVLFSFNRPEATCSSLLPPSLSRPILFGSFLLTSPQMKPPYAPFITAVGDSAVFISISLLPAAQGQMQGNGLPAGCQRESYSWKALSHSCCCCHDLKKGRGGREYGWDCTGWVFGMRWNKTARGETLELVSLQHFDNTLFNYRSPLQGKECFCYFFCVLSVIWTNFNKTFRK